MTSIGDLRRGLIVTQSEIANKIGVPTESVARLEDKPILGATVGELALYMVALGGQLQAIIPAPNGTERRIAL